MAAIPGASNFPHVVHSSQLDQLELKGKKVVIIGSGASGVEAAELVVEKEGKEAVVLARDDKWSVTFVFSFFRFISDILNLDLDRIIPRNTLFDVMLSLQPFGREMVRVLSQTSIP
jgi:hypothetical protein